MESNVLLGTKSVYFVVDILKEGCYLRCGASGIRSEKSKSRCIVSLGVALVASSCIAFRSAHSIAIFSGQYALITEIQVCSNQ